MHDLQQRFKARAHAHTLRLRVFGGQYHAAMQRLS